MKSRSAIYVRPRGQGTRRQRLKTASDGKRLGKVWRIVSQKAAFRLEVLPVKQSCWSDWDEGRIVGKLVQLAEVEELMARLEKRYRRWREGEC